MSLTATEFQEKSLDERVALVREKLRQARLARERLLSGDLDRGSYIPAWETAFETYLEAAYDDLRWEYG